MKIGGAEFTDDALDSLIDAAMTGADLEASRVRRMFCAFCWSKYLAMRLCGETIQMLNALVSSPASDSRMIRALVIVAGALAVQDVWAAGEQSYE